MLISRQIASYSLVEIVVKVIWKMLGIFSACNISTNDHILRASSRQVEQAKPEGNIASNRSTGTHAGWYTQVMVPQGIGGSSPAYTVRFSPDTIRRRHVISPHPSF
jgi:hypothetical protein